MSRRNRLRINYIVEHRRYVHQQAIGALIEGKTTPDYVKERADKYKQVKHLSRQCSRRLHRE